MSFTGGIGAFFDIRFPAAGPGGFGFPGWGGVGGSYNPGRTRSTYTPWTQEVLANIPGITTSRELPGSTHWDPAPVPVGDARSGGSSDAGVVFQEGSPIPVLGLPRWLPDFRNEGQPPIIYSPPPIVLPGQTDPGREEREEGEDEVAHTWLHLGSQVLGGFFPDQNPLAYSGYAPGAAPGTLGPFDPGAETALAVPGAGPMSYTGSCPPAKTRTLTIDCATGLEVKRKRRRRRALLTQGDMGVLFQIASLPNNANVRVALAGAIRR